MKMTVFSLKFQFAFALALVLINIGVLAAKKNKNNVQLNFRDQFFYLRKPFNNPFLNPYEQLNNFNVSEQLMNLMKSSESLGHAFADEWYQIVKEVDEPTKRDFSSCLDEINSLVNGLSQGKMSSIRYFDSWGKIPAGLLKGHTVEMGNFDECVDLRQILSDNKELLGKYCLARIPILDDSLNIDIGVCMTAECPAEVFDIFLRAFFKSLLNINLQVDGELVNNETCTLRQKQAFEGWDYVAIVVMIILGLAMLYSTLYEYYCRWKKATPSPILISFSVLTNLSQLLSVQENKKNSNVIPCLNGIRVLSIIWVVYGHVFGLYLELPMINPVDLLTWKRTAFSMFIQFAAFSVDSFFFLSGFLVAFITLREIQKNNGKLNVPLMYLHRYLRLTPMLALAFLVYTTMYPHLANGPIFKTFAPWKIDCYKWWWSSLLYVQNYVNVDYMCYGHTWYLAVDMQLYILSPIFLLVLWKWQRKGFAAVGIVAFGFVALLFGLVMAKAKDTYFLTHARTSPWFVGLFLGYYMHHTKNKRVKLSKLMVACGWLVCFAIIAAVLFSFYPAAHSEIPPTVVEDAFYLSFARLGWGIALSWIVFTSVNGYGGIVSAFLSSPLWQPLARLSYCIFIWHIAVIEFHVGRVKVNKYFSDYDVMLKFWGDFGWTLILCVVMHLAFEAPLVHLERIWLPRSKPKTVKPTSAK